MNKKKPKKVIVTLHKVPFWKQPIVLVACAMLVVGTVVYATQSNGNGSTTSLRVECRIDGVLTVPDDGYIYVNNVPRTTATGFLEMSVEPGPYTARATCLSEEKSQTEEVLSGEHEVILLTWITNGPVGYSPSEDFNLNKMGAVIVRELPEESQHAIRGSVIYSGGHFHVWYAGHNGAGYFYLIYAEVSQNLDVIRKEVIGTSVLVPWSQPGCQWTEGHACVVGDSILWAYVAQTSYNSKFWANTHIGLAIIRPPDYTTLEFLSLPIYNGDGTAGNPGLVYANGYLYLFFCEGSPRNLYWMSTPYSPASPYSFSWSPRQPVVMDYNIGDTVTDWTPYFVDSMSRWEVYARVRPQNQIYCWYTTSLTDSWTYVGNPVTGGVTIGGRVAQNMDAWGENVYNVMGTYYLWYGLNNGGGEQHVARGWDR